MNQLLERGEFVAQLHAIGERAYHDKHPFHVAMNEGRLSKEAIRGWVANRFYYQQNIPRKDAAILANCPAREVRRIWVHRILDHDGVAKPTVLDAGAAEESVGRSNTKQTQLGSAAEDSRYSTSGSYGEGGIEAWLRLGEACGLTRNELLQNVDVLAGVRFAVDAYVNFARTQLWPVAIASSLTELFAPDLMASRLSAFEKHYRWIDSGGLDYFRQRILQAGRDSSEALSITLRHCATAELQQAALTALKFKCDVLWSILDAIHRAYGE